MEHTNHCDECGLDFFYEPSLHVCASRGRKLSGSEHGGESWVNECMRKQRSTHVIRSFTSAELDDIADGIKP